MRDWQKSLTLESAPVSDPPLPDTKATPLPPQVMWSAATAILVFAVLVSVRPPFVESSDMEKPLEPRRLNWPLVVVSAVSSGLVVLLVSSL